MARTYFPTAHVETVESYPYGRKRTRAFFGTEFHPKKGYRTTFQTVNPDNGRVNAVKKSTYSDLFIMFRDEASGHVKHAGTGILSEGDERRNKAAEFCALHFHLFTLPELQYLYFTFHRALQVTYVAAIQYGGASTAKARAFYSQAWKVAEEGFNKAKAGEAVNLFASLTVDAEAAKNLRDADFNPFTVTETTMNEAGQMETTVTRTADPIRV